MSSKPLITASVRELVSFVLRSGDLGGSGHFGGPNRAVEGTRGHQYLQKRRPAAYEAEVIVKWKHEAADFIFELNGRIDGVLRGKKSVLIEEIKTIRHTWSGPVDSLHLAQAKIYAALFCAEHTFAKADVCSAQKSAA